MAATIHPFPERMSAADAALATLAQQLADELRAHALRPLALMFDTADDVLFDLSEKSASDKERRPYFDAMRLLRLHRAPMSERFETHFTRGFTQPLAPDPGNAAPVSTLSLQAETVTEENIACANLTSRLESLCAPELWELHARLHVAIQRGAPLSAEALSARHLCSAFRAAVGDVDVDVQVRLVLYKLFERRLLVSFPELIDAARQILDRVGCPPAPPSATPRPAGTQLPAAPASAPLVLDAAAQAVFQAYVHPWQSTAPSPAQAGHAAWTPPASAWQDLLPRASIIRQAFQETLGARFVPTALRERFAVLNDPIAHVALTDRSFFTDPEHPVRRALSTLADASARLRASTPGTAEALDARIESAIEQILIAATQTRPAGPSAPLHAEDLLRFVSEQRQLAEQRRAAMIRTAVTSVGQTLADEARQRSIPAQAQPFFDQGWIPVMALQLLRSGAESSEWKRSLDMARTLLTRLDMASEAPDTQGDEALLAGLRRELRTAGLSADKVEQCMRVIETAVAEAHGKATQGAQAPVPQLDPASLQKTVAANTPMAPAAPAPASTPAVAAPLDHRDPLARVLVPQGWYRVYDPASAHTRWMQLTHCPPGLAHVAFCAFDASERLSLSRAQVIAQLLSGQAAPIQPGDDYAARIEALRELEG